MRLGGEAEIEVARARRAFATAVAGTASNPATIVSWAAIFSAAGTVAEARSPVLLVLGVAAGSAAWTTALALALGSARRHVGERALRLADAVAGVGMLGFGGALAYDGARAIDAR